MPGQLFAFPVTAKPPLGECVGKAAALVGEILVGQHPVGGNYGGSVWVGSRNGFVYLSEVVRHEGSPWI